MMRLTLRSILTIACLLVFLGHAALISQVSLAGNWPRFRGPNGTGIAKDESLPAKWTDANILWKTPLPGLGHSSPIVWDNRVFLQATTKDGKHRMFLCVDATNGKILWQQKRSGQWRKTHRHNNLAASTPATDGKHVYVVFWDGRELTLEAFNFQGESAWKRQLGTFKGNHGAGLSPMVYKGMIYLNNDQDGSANVLALDASNGKTVWSVKRKAFKTCYSVPFITGGDTENPELIVGSTAGLASYDPKTGKENWKYNWEFPGGPLRTVGSPVAGAGLIFLSSGNGGGARNMIAVKTGGKGELPAKALAWSDRRAFLPYVPTFLVKDDRLYSVNDFTGIVTCKRIPGGDVAWTQRMNTEVWASPVLADGKLFVAGKNGTVYVIKDSPTYQLLARNPLDEVIYATPAVSNNRLFVRGDKHLFCIGAARKGAGSR